MRSLGLGFVILLLVAHPLLFVGCNWEGVKGTKEHREMVDRENPATVLTVERLDFPKFDGSASDVLKFEVEFSDGTKAGCIHIWSGLQCLPLKGEL